MANTRRRSQRGGRKPVNVNSMAVPGATASPAPEGGARRRSQRGGRPPPPPGTPTLAQISNYVTKCTAADSAVIAAKDAIASDPATAQPSQQAQLQAQKDAHVQALKDAEKAVIPSCTSKANTYTNTTIDAAADAFSPSAPVTYAEGGRRSRRSRRSQRGGGKPGKQQQAADLPPYVAGSVELRYIDLCASKKPTVVTAQSAIDSLGARPTYVDVVQQQNWDTANATNQAALTAALGRYNDPASPRGLCKADVENNTAAYTTYAASQVAVGGSVNVQTATNAGTPVPNILRSNGRAPNKPSKGAVVGGRRGGKTRKASPWNLFVKKIYGEMKRKHGKGASFSDALKEASRRKKEM